MPKTKIYPSIVTTRKSNWRQQIRDLDRFHIKEASIFLTVLNRTKRQEFYKLLKKTNLKYIPHVHLRNDMTQKEVKWLIDNYKVNYFTVHLCYLKHFINWKIAKKICVENNGFENYGPKDIRNFDLIEKVGGLAIDISHWGLAEATNQKTFEANESLIKRFPIVINHLGGLKKNPKGEDDLHFINNPQKNFEFLNSIPKKIISPHIFLEIGNSIKKQVRIRDYLYRRYLT